MLSPILADILLVVLLVGMLILLARSLFAGAGTQAALDARLDEQGKRMAQLEERIAELRVSEQEAASGLRERLTGAFAELREEMKAIQSIHAQRMEQRHGETVKNLSESLHTGMTNVQKQVGEYLRLSSEDLGKRMDGLSQKTDQRLQEISGQVEKRLAEGFEKTTATFGDILKRLALIDEAQKKITELSSNVVSLQEILADKRSRGAFGEVQLSALVRNVMPEGSFALQHGFDTDQGRVIADCVLFLPEPTGTVAIDAKFPLESYRQMTDVAAPEEQRRSGERQFRLDIQKHISDIAAKYIIPGKTSDGAIMFIPAEAVFAEIHAHYPELVEKALTARVWMVSPTTLWATLNTARAVLKDAATREQVHVIQEHLSMLAKDFSRFQQRMDDLARHIDQAHRDVEQVHTSARKISSRFEKIERVELGSGDGVTSREISVDDPGEM